jgi:hypothetical protein
MTRSKKDDECVYERETESVRELDIRYREAAITMKWKHALECMIEVF